MAAAHVVYEFEYLIADRHRKGDVQFPPKPDHDENQGIWRRYLLRAICEEIGRAEPDLVLDTPYGLLGDTSVRDHHRLERVAYLRLTVEAVPELVYNLNDYSFFRRVDGNV